MWANRVSRNNRYLHAQARARNSVQTRRDLLHVYRLTRAPPPVAATRLAKTETNLRRICRRRRHRAETSPRGLTPNRRVHAYAIYRVNSKSKLLNDPRVRERCTCSSDTGDPARELLAPYYAMRIKTQTRRRKHPRGRNKRRPCRNERGVVLRSRMNRFIVAARG